ncbi:MAG: hypothetical protein NVSMB51_01720 [Solirubrobacteraceae bacterium]
MTQPNRPGQTAEQAGTLAHSLRPAEVVAMLDHVGDGIVVLGNDWCCRYVNDPAAAMLGRERDGLLGHHMAVEFPDGVMAPFHLAYDRAMREQVRVQIVEYYAPLGRWFENRIFPHGDSLVIVFRDVTERQRTEDELQEYAERMTEAERIASFGVWKWEIATGRVRWSAQLHRIYGVAPGEFPGTVDDFLSRLHPDDRDAVWSHVGRAIETLEPFAFEERIVRDSGEERLLLSRGRVLVGPDGRASALVGICHDVTERAQAERALGISERRVRAIIDNTPSIVAVKGLDERYLMTNAEIGRVLGMPPDELIGQRCDDVFPADLARRFQANDHKAVAEGEPVYDEAVLLRDGEPRTYLTVTFALPDEDGVATELCTIGTDVTENRERASERRLRLETTSRIETALRDDRMLVYAQPVVDLASGAACLHELLVRMVERDRLVEPAAILPAAERFGLIQQLDLWMVSQALRLASQLTPGVNLSALTLCDPAATRQITAMLEAAPEAAAKLMFEITETAAAEHLEAASNFAAEIADLGCSLALDDFGTGFSSFTYLRMLPVACLKIDRSFVRDLVHSASDRRIVQSIIGIAREFDICTIAEGVEDEPTLELLRAMGADRVQGFHLGRPAVVRATGGVT